MRQLVMALVPYGGGSLQCIAASFWLCNPICMGFCRTLARRILVCVLDGHPSVLGCLLEWGHNTCYPWCVPNPVPVLVPGPACLLMQGST